MFVDYSPAGNGPLPLPILIPFFCLILIVVLVKFFKR